MGSGKTGVLVHSLETASILELEGTHWGNGTGRGNAQSMVAVDGEDVFGYAISRREGRVMVSIEA